MAITHQNKKRINIQLLTPKDILQQDQPEDILSSTTTEEANDHHPAMAEIHPQMDRKTTVEARTMSHKSRWDLKTSRPQQNREIQDIENSTKNGEREIKI